jgi:hypothetical protein
MRILTILKEWLINSFPKKKRILNPCQLTYIPKRLHTNDKEPVEVFNVGEFLYRRCKPEDLLNPYNSISLAEISHNRAGEKLHIVSYENDVLINIVKDLGFERYDNMVVCKIKILDLTANGQYNKSFNDDKGNVAKIMLLHEPEPCMYPHCVFRVWYNEEVAKMDNKQYTRNNQIRIKLKHELAGMIYTNTLSQIN